MVCFFPLTHLVLLWLAYFSPPFFLWILCFALILHWISLLSLCIPFVVLLCFFFIWFSICVGFFLLSFSYFSLEFFECIFFASLAFSCCFLLNGSDGFSPSGCPCLFPCHGLEAFPQLAGWSMPGSCPSLLLGMTPRIFCYIFLIIIPFLFLLLFFAGFVRCLFVIIIALCSLRVLTLFGLVFVLT